MMNSIDPTNDNRSEESFLDSVRKPPPMAAPEGYFASFGDRLKERLEEEQLQAEAPVLFGMPRRTPFTVPIGYFTHFASTVRTRIDAAESGRIKPMFLSLYATAAAAVILVLVMWKGAAPVTQEYPDLPDLSAEELLAVVDIEESLIIESLVPEDFDQLMEELPFPVTADDPVVQEAQTAPVEAELSFDDLLDELEELDEESLDALEAELLEMDDSDWY